MKKPIEIWCEVVSPEAIAFGKATGFTKDYQLTSTECGLHSGIPPCCILYFLLTRTNNNDILRELERKACALAGIDAYYAICPSCILARRVIETKRCNCSNKEPEVPPEYRTTDDATKRFIESVIEEYRVDLREARHD